MRLLGKPILALSAGVIGLVGALAGAAPSAAAPAAASFGAPLALTASAAPRLPLGATLLGAVPAQQTMHLDVTLTMRDQAGLEALLNGLSNQNSPYFRDFLTSAQIGAMFGPTLGQLAEVENALRAAGLTPGQVEPNRLAIPVTATAAQVEQAFGIRLLSYRLSGGRIAYANATAPHVGAVVAPLVSGVLGLDDLYQLQNMAEHVTAPAAPAAKPAAAVPALEGPQPCLAAGDEAVKYGSYTANQIAEHYGLAALYTIGDLGQGVHVAVAEFEPNLASDISAYEACYKIHTTVHWRSIDGGVGTGDGSGEAALDIEQIASLAPDSVIDVYQVPNTISDFFDMFNTFVNTGDDKVLNVSWGLCEPDFSSTQITEISTAIQQADAEGKTIVAAAGDTGSTDCYGGTTDATTLAVDSPASSPYVVAVGGTHIASDAPLSPETVFNESIPVTEGGSGAAGGGLSTVWCMPSYQYQSTIPGLDNPTYSESNSSCKGTTAGTNAKGLVRQVPDISADADPYSGYVIYFDGAWEGGWGGTSASTTVMAAIAALIDASPYCVDWKTGDAGLLPQTLYKTVAAQEALAYPASSSQVPAIISDVTSGNNDYTISGYTGGLYPATRGYDMASGLGVPLVMGFTSNLQASAYWSGLASMMCRTLAPAANRYPKVTGVSPKTGTAGKSITVTLHGSGFLAIPGADIAKIVTGPLTHLKTYLMTAHCKSLTVCTVTLPALSARTVDISMSVAASQYSAYNKGDRFTYVNKKKTQAPSIVDAARFTFT